jgi:hypothetical protein
MTIVPFDPASVDQEMNVRLGDTTYLLRATWNTRAAVWSLSISTEDGDPIISGAPMLAGWDPTLPYVRENMPTGRFILIDSQGTNDNSTPSRYELGRDARFKLIYDDGTT